MKKLVGMLLMVVLLGTMLLGCSQKDEDAVRVGVLKGPTGVGAILIMDKAESGEYDKYSFTLSADPTDIVARLTNGDLDIGALPTNTAANLYNKTNGDIQMIAINCTSVLYILENGNSIQSVQDLKGKTVYVNGQGANPEYVLNFVLRANGLEPGKDVDVQFKEASEISAMMISEKAEICMLPVPAATTVTMKNDKVRMALNMGEEYAKAANDGSELTMGCLVATKSFLSEHPEAVRIFLERYEKSIEEVSGDVKAAAELVAKYEITGNAAIAEKAIPDCGIVCITGKDMKEKLSGYYQVLYDANPASIGGNIPKDEFYYEK